MAIIKCKMCGGDIEISADKTFGTCEYCGNTMTLPKIDDDQRAAAFNRGNHFRRIGEFDKAMQVYERIVQEDDTDAEAHWCCALCRFGIEYVEDPATFEWLPTCHRASFDSFLEDVDYLAAVEHSNGLTRKQYIKDGAKIAEVQRGILATSQNEKPYDVFICYKETDENGERTRDSAMAQDIYYQLTEQGRRVFFARITLEDVAGREYEPYIFAALNSAKVMVVVGTSAEHLNAVWVKNEWSRFLSMMRHDRNKIILPCYRDMDPYDLPEQLSILQSYDMSKIGFIQDLTRGIAKVLDADKKPEAVPESVVVQQTAGNVDALLKRGYMALEDHEWNKADEFFEEVLNQNAECAEAYMGKMFAENKAVSLNEVISQHLQDTEEVIPDIIPFPNDEEHIEAIVQKYSIPHYIEKKNIVGQYDIKLTYKSEVAQRKQQLQKEKQFWKENHNLARALQFWPDEKIKEVNDAKTELFTAFDQRINEAREREKESYQKTQKVYKNELSNADEIIEMMYKKADEERKKRYDEYVETMNTRSDIWGLRQVARDFLDLGNYLDSELFAEKCRKRAVEIETDTQKRNEEMILQEQRRLKGLCQYCGGTFKGLLVKKCSKCGRPKDY